MIKRDIKFHMPDSKHIDVYGLTFAPDELSTFTYTKNSDGGYRFYVERTDILYLLLLRLDLINCKLQLDVDGNII